MTPLFRSLAHARGSDARGIALQTVIIIVVLLAIAGAVAGVLFARAGDVTDELASADVTATTIDTEAECVSHMMGGVAGAWTAPGTCTWTAAANGANPTDVTSGRCAVLRGGAYTAGDSSNAATCVVN